MIANASSQWRRAAVQGARALSRGKFPRTGNFRLHGSASGAKTNSNAWRVAVGGLAIAGGSVAALSFKQPALAESETTSEPEAPTEGFTDRVLRFVGLGSWVDWVIEPAEAGGLPAGKLLPDQPELPPGAIQRTLVLSLEDVLVHTEWDRKRGHRTKKRPGLEAFLAHMSQFYEIVIFTSAMSSYGMPIAQHFQELGYVTSALFREHTKYVHGKHIKDLSYLNRDLRHVVIVDNNPVSYSHQPLNGIGIKPWHDDLEDAELLNLVPFLEAIVKEDIQDVREVLKHFQGTKVPDKFRELKHHAVEKRRAGVSSIIGRSRAPPGVLPVLTPLVPRGGAITPALTQAVPEKKKEVKRGGGLSAPEDKKEGLATQQVQEQKKPEEPSKPMNVFQLAKQHK
mmetsp:Transcript_46086/g.108137  ORF Transcript_46086/g.108137 Transcript_46086/m.108137 type:complete len:396 (-) Transcript_46086:218-1405(-)